MPLVPSSAMPVGNLAKVFATTVKIVSLIYTLFESISPHQSILVPTITPWNFVSAPPIAATEIQQRKQRILCPTDSANTQFQPVREIQSQQTHEEQLQCQANGACSQLQSVTGFQQTQQDLLLCHNIIASTHSQPVTGIQHTQEKTLHHSSSSNIQIQPVRAIQVQQTHQKQLLYHADRANAYTQPVTCIQLKQQQPQLLKSQSDPPQRSKFMTDLPYSGSAFHHVSQTVIPIPQQQICVPYVHNSNPIPEAGSSNWKQPYKVNDYTASMPTLAVHQHVPQPIHQMNGSTTSVPTFAAVPQYGHPPNTTKAGNNLMGHVVEELVDGFIPQARGGYISKCNLWRPSV
ncbi:hypothetical protein QQP08_016504 [Theobroma cacao]|nr:hypothetical protein QQP08_016504 [Theobroma cacao]